MAAESTEDHLLVVEVDQPSSARDAEIGVQVPGSSLESENSYANSEELEFSTYYSYANLEEDEDRKPSITLKGILKSSKKYSDSEKQVEVILDELLTSASAAPQILQLHCAKELFSTLCFDEFFQTGECLNSSCDLNHDFKTYNFHQHVSKVWLAALYVIFQAPIPSVEVVKRLVNYFSGCSSVKTLAIAKCLAKVKFTHRLALAEYITNTLAQHLSRRDAVTQILILNFGHLQTQHFNELMEGLGVFKSNSAQYSDLLQFLNYQKHHIPPNLLFKLVKDAVEFDGPESFSDSVAGLAGNLLPEELEELKNMDNIVDEFFVKFKPTMVASKLPTTVGGHLSSVKKNSKTNRVAFKSSLVKVKIFKPEPTFEGADIEVTCSGNSTSTVSHPGDILQSVFGETCIVWLLHGKCSKLVCFSNHDFPEDSLKDKHPKDVFVALEFIAEETLHPNVRVLQEFVNYAGTCANGVTKVLQFRKCIPRMDKEEGENLTELILAQLCSHMDPFQAVEKVMFPNLLILHNKDDNSEQFSFSANLIVSIMHYAVQRMNTISNAMKCEIMRRWVLLPAAKCASTLEICNKFMDKFFLQSNLQASILGGYYPIPPRPKFSSCFKHALLNGAQSKFFIACTLLKFALDHGMTELAGDDLFAFLLGHFARAKILKEMFDTLVYFLGRDKISIRELLRDVAIRLCVHFYDNESFECVAQIFSVLREHKVDFFEVHSQDIEDFDLAVVYCSSQVDFQDEEVINTFLERCLQPFLDNACFQAVVPEKLICLTNKMFSRLYQACSVEQQGRLIAEDALLKLFWGIFTRQNSLVCPLKLTGYYEPTLRYALCESSLDNIRKMSLKLYCDVTELRLDVRLQRATYRSLLITAAADVRAQHDAGHGKCTTMPNFFCPLIKNILRVCLEEGVYPKMINGDKITLLSSMSHEELKIYSLWWFCLFLRAKKRRKLDYFYNIPVNIVQDYLKNELHLPVHPRLQTIDPSISACESRFVTILENITDNTFDHSTMFRPLGAGIYQLRFDAVASISEAVLCVMKENSLIRDDSVKMLCSFCFDERNDIILPDQIP